MNRLLSATCFFIESMLYLFVLGMLAIIVAGRLWG